MSLPETGTGGQLESGRQPVTAGSCSAVLHAHRAENDSCKEGEHTRITFISFAHTADLSLAHP